MRYLLDRSRKPFTDGLKYRRVLAAAALVAIMVAACEGGAPAFTPVPNATPTPAVSTLDPTSRPTGGQSTPSTPTPSPDEPAVTPGTPPTRGAATIPAPTPEPPAPGGAPSSPITVAMELSPFQPATAGGEALITVEVTSFFEAAGVDVTLELGEGLELVEGDRTWTGDLAPGSVASFEWRIRALVPGAWSLKVGARQDVGGGSYFGGRADACLIVTEKSIEIDQEPCPPPDSPSPGIQEGIPVPPGPASPPGGPETEGTQSPELATPRSGEPGLSAP